MSKSRCSSCGQVLPPGARFCQGCGTETKSQATKNRPKARLMTYFLGAGAVILVAAFILSGYQAPSPSTGSHETAQHATEASMIKSAGPMPNWLAMADPLIIQDYVWAADHHKELQYIPCYCGCGGIGHTSNSSCYFKRDKAGTILAYDNHSTG